MTLNKAISAAATALLAGAVAAGASAQAHAQNAGVFFERDRNVSVLERQRDEYVSPGRRSGVFFVRPSVEVGLEANNNIFATGADEESDLIARLAPEIEIESAWSVHEFVAMAQAERLEYIDFSDESVWNLDGAAGVRLDIVRGSYLEGGLRLSSLHEPRTSAGLARQAAEPIQFDVAQFDIGATHTRGRIRLFAGADFTTLDYDDVALFAGGVGDQDFRDRDEQAFTVRADAAISPDTALFARARINARDYDLAPPDVAFERSSEGYTIDVGADFDVGGVARGEVAIGYTEQDYDSALLPDVDGLSVQAAVEWFPTQLTTISVEALRTIRDAAIIGSGAYVNTQASVRIDHELRRNLILSGVLARGEDDYQGVDRNDARWDAVASAIYLVSPQVGLRGSLRHVSKDSSGAAASTEYDVTSAHISLELRL